MVETPKAWCAGLVGAPKAAGGYRLCVNLTKLNQVILREQHIMPTVDQAFGLPGSATIFLKLGAMSGFHHLRLFERCQEYMTFITPFGRFYYCCLPFGIKSAPEVFLSPMSLILEGIKGCVNMVDDNVVFGRDRSKPDSQLQSSRDCSKQELC